MQPGSGPDHPAHAGRWRADAAPGGARVTTGARWPGPQGHGGAADAGLPSIRTLKRWLAYRHEHHSALAPRQAQADMRVPAWARAFLECYQQPQKPSLEAAYRDACAAWAADERPSIHQVRRFIKKVGAVTLQRGRMGPRELKTIQPFIRRGFEHLEPNDIWSADGHTFDAEVQHPYHGRPFRPEITSIVDIATRRLVGWSVGLAETAVGVADAIRHAVEFAGLPATFYVDNGSGFSNAFLKDEVTGLQGRLGFEVRHSLPYNSQARGVIERLHQTVWVAGAKLLPSYMGAAMDREARLAQFKLTRQALKAGPNGRVVQMPLVPWDVFMAFCAERVAEYNARAHRTLKGVSPDLRWREFELKGWQAHTIHPADLEQIMRPRVMRTLARGEIILFTNIYACPNLAEFHGETVQVAYDMHRPEKIWVYTPDGRYMGEAIADGNRKHYYPVAVVEQDREKRAQGRLKRVAATAKEIREELHGATYDALPDGAIVLGTKIVGMDEVRQLEAQRAEQDARRAAEKAAAAREASQAMPHPAPDVVTPERPATPSAKPLRSQRTAAENMAEWDAVDARVRAGEAVDEDAAYWHGTFQRHPQWVAEMKRRAQEKPGTTQRAG